MPIGMIVDCCLAKFTAFQQKGSKSMDKRACAVSF